MLVREICMINNEVEVYINLVFQISCQISSTSSSPSSDKENAKSEMPGSFVKKVQRIYCLILHLGISLLVFSLSGKAYMYIQTCCKFESESLSLNTYNNSYCTY